MQYCAVNSEELDAAPVLDQSPVLLLASQSWEVTCKELAMVKTRHQSHNGLELRGRQSPPKCESRPQSFGSKQRFHLTQHFKPSSISELTNTII